MGWTGNSKVVSPRGVSALAGAHGQIQVMAVAQGKVAARLHDPEDGFVALEFLL